MTRLQALAMVRAITDSAMTERQIVDFVDCLEALDVIKFDTIDDATFKAAGEMLAGKFVHCANGDIQPLSIGGAYEVLDVLRKSGFKITKE